MSKPDWLTRVRSYSDEARAKRSGAPTEIATALVEAHSLLSKLPLGVKTEFNGITETELLVGILGSQSRILRGDFRLPPFGDEPRDVTRALVTHIRALDRSLKELQVERSVVSNAESSWRVCAGEGEAFVIPRNRRRDMKSVSVGKRALEWHHIIPTEIGGYAIKVFQAQTKFGAAPNEVPYGATLFEELKFVEGKGKKPDTILVVGVDAANMTAVIDAALQNAHVKRCAFLAFPELTIDPDRRTLIQNALRTRPWPGAEKFTVAVVVAGSWHEEGGGGDTYNVATVFDGYGERVATHQKLLAYFDTQLQKGEGIELGREITLVAFQDALVAFGICKDFCERSAENPYANLDVDLCAVISTGNDVTMQGHLDTARDAHNRYGVSTVVVQQAAPNRERGLGFVLTPYDNLRAGIEAFVRSTEWTILPGGEA